MYLDRHLTRVQTISLWKCLSRYRLFSMDVLAGIAALAEYDKIFFNHNFVFGVEEISGVISSSLAYQKTLQALALSLYFPWLPYRIDNNILKVLANFKNYYSSSGYRYTNIPLADVEKAVCLDTQPYDLILGELANIIKYSALVPAYRSSYEELLQQSLKNIKELLEGLTLHGNIDIYELVVENIFTASSLSDRLNEIHKVLGKLNNIINRDVLIKLRDEIEDIKYFPEEFKKNKEWNLIMFLPFIQTEYYALELLRYLIRRFLKNVHLNVTIYHPYISNVVYALREELKNLYITFMDKKYRIDRYEDVKKLIEELTDYIENSARPVMVVIVLDLEKTLLYELTYTLFNIKNKPLIFGVLTTRITFDENKNEVSYGPSFIRVI